MNITKDHRHLREDEVQHVQLTSSQAQLLVDAAAVSVVTQKVSLTPRVIWKRFSTPFFNDGCCRQTWDFRAVERLLAER